MSITLRKIALGGILVVVAVAVPMWQQDRIDKLGADNLRLQDQVSETLKKREEENKPRANASALELQSMREANEKLQTEVLQLRGRVSAATTATVKAQSLAAEAVANKETNTLHSGISGMMRGVMEQQLMGKLPLMKTKLKLTDTQEEAVRDILRKQVDQAVEGGQKMLSGKMTKEEMSSIQKSAGNPEEQIKAVLTPEQLPLYQEYKTEENSSNARLVANAELIQMQSSLGLNQEQQDQAYKALYEYTFNQLSGKLADNMPKSGDMGATMKWVVDQKVKALESVLNADQLKQYRDLQENQAKLMSSMMPAEGNKAP